MSDAPPLRAGICEHDDALRDALRRALTQGGFETTAVATGPDAELAFGAAPPDVLIVDIDLPGADGRDVCRRLRDRGVATPVLFTSRDPDVASRRAATAAGGDDYLVKPFMLAELLVRVGGLIGPAPVSAHARLDTATMSVTAAAGRVDLTPTEFRLLALLAGHRGELIERAQLVAAGWPDGATVSDNTLDAYVARIRRKLRAAGAPEALRTRRGVGYELR
ncbi:response regulator transcription factor [Conexibacter woesei]|uniref:response regulator transcription factor n=1 Tax=Conexibacter woesei TaxID=191495 RepID=UPI000409163B|nr:response regulator transcription factor [Conexibacter woesei]